MYKSFEVKNFRCFRELKIDDLERVNLIAGMNNVGKTALLEAIFLHCGAYNPTLVVKLSSFRGLKAAKIEGRWVEVPWDSLFNQFDLSKSIELVGKNTLTGRRILRLGMVSDQSKLAKIPQSISYIIDEAGKPVLSSSEIVQVLELEYEERGQHGSSYMILDSKGGIRADPIIHLTPPFPASFQLARIRIDFLEEAERFGKLEIHGEQDVLLKTLQIIEPRLCRLATVVVAGVPILHGDIGIGRLVPLPDMGEGMVRLASLVLQIGNVPNGVALIDEIENGLHHLILVKVWQAIGEVARQFNTQVFATTHSLECIVAAHKAFTKNGVYDFRLHRLERLKETIHAVTYDQETLEAAIETDLEVR